MTTAISAMNFPPLPDFTSIQRFMRIRQIFGRACQTVTVLSKQAETLGIRMDNAERNHQMAFKYSLQLQMTTLHGLIDMYREYATRKADEPMDLASHIEEMGLAFQQAYATLELDHSRDNDSYMWSGESDDEDMSDSDEEEDMIQDDSSDDDDQYDEGDYDHEKTCHEDAKLLCLASS